MNNGFDWRGHIVADADVLSGKPRLRGTRLSVALVLELLAGGWDHASLRAEYPALTDDALRAVFAFAADSIAEQRLYVLPPTG